MKNQYRKELPKIQMLKEVNKHQLTLLSLFLNFVDYLVDIGYPQCDLNFCIRNLKKGFEF